MTTAKRVPLVPEYPTIAEVGFPGYESGQWYGILVPVKTPKEIVTTIQGHLISVLKLPDVVKRLNDLGYIIIGDRPEEFSAHMKSEVQKLAKVLRNVTAD